MQPTQIKRSTGSTAPDSLLAGQLAYCEGSDALYIGTIAGGVQRIGLGSAVTTLSIASGVVNVDCSLGDYFTLALTANVTSLTFSNVPAAGTGRTLCIDVTQDATGGWTFALPSSFKAIGNSDTAIQSAANAKTRIIPSTTDGGTTWDYAMGKVAA